MQKFIVSLFAIASSLGLFAEGLDPSPHLSGANFQNENFRVGEEFFTRHDDTNGAPDSAGTPSFWITNDEDDFEGTISSYMNGEEEIKYLDFESNITNPVYRTINDCYNADSISGATSTNIGKGLFMDTRVKFTPYTVTDVHTPPIGLEGDTVPADCQDKLVIWLREQEVVDLNDDSITNMVTNLVATAAYYDGGSMKIRHYELILPENSYSSLVTDFHRLTIKAFENITENSVNEAVGFVVYLDEQVLGYSPDVNAGTDGSIIGSLNGTAAKYYKDGLHQLLPSLRKRGQTDTQTISAVGYSGTGAVSEIYFDDYYHEVPDWASDDFYFTIAWTEGVTSFTYGSFTTNNITCAGSMQFHVRPSVEEVKITGVNYANGYKGRAGLWHDNFGSSGRPCQNVGSASNDQGTFNIKDSPTILTIAAFKANYTVGDKEFDTLFGNSWNNYMDGAWKEALSGGTLKLMGDILIAESQGTLLELGGSDQITIDLNGHTLQASDGGEDIVTIFNEGNLTIIDSVGGGKVLAPQGIETGYNAILMTDGAVMRIDGGEYDYVGPYEEYEDDLTLSLFGGKYYAPYYVTDDDEVRSKLEEIENSGSAEGLDDDEIEQRKQDYLMLARGFELATYVQDGYAVVHTAESDKHYFTVAPGVEATIGKTDAADGIASVVVTQGLDAVTSESDDKYTVASGIAFTVTYKAKNHYLFGNGTDTTNATYNITANAEYDAPETHADLVTLTLNYEADKVVPTVKQDGAEKTGESKVYQVLKGVEFEITWTTKGIWVFEDDGSTEKVEKYTLSASEKKSAPAVKEGIVEFTVTFDPRLTGTGVFTNGTEGGTVEIEPVSGSTYKAIAGQPITIAATAADHNVIIKKNGEEAESPITLVKDMVITVGLDDPTGFPCAGTTVTDPAQTGSAEHPYLLASAADFAALKIAVADGTAGKYTYKVVGDNITLSAWEGIGSSSAKFTGSIDGNGQTISIEFKRMKGIGLFNYIVDGVISDLTIEVTGFTGEAPVEWAVAAFAGRADDVTFNNCVAKGTIADTTHNAAAFVIRDDEIAGTKNIGNIFNDCVNEANVSGSYTKVGGFMAFQTQHVTFNRCWNKGSITQIPGEGGGDCGCGAFVGLRRAQIDINSCTNTGVIASTKILAYDVAQYGQLIGAAASSDCVDGIALTGTNVVRIDTPLFKPTTPNGAWQYGLVDGDKATLCAAADFAEGATYVTFKAGLTPEFELQDENDTIAFNTNLYAVANFYGITTPAEDPCLEVVESESAGVVTLTAAVKTFTVTFNNGEHGGDAPDPITGVRYGSTVTVPTAPTDDAYDFGGWYTDAERENQFSFDTPITDNTTLYAKWTIKKYEVSYTVDGQAAESETVEHGEKPKSIPEIPAKTGYTFTGWSPSDPTNAVITCATNFVTTYAKIPYAITYDYGAGVGPATSNQETYVISTEAQTIHLTAPTPDAGYAFTGFTLKEAREGVEFNDKTNMVIAAGQIDPISVQANYQVITYTISYDYAGGTDDGTNPKTYTVNDEITIYDANREGYTFDGWTWDDQNKPQKNVVIQVGHIDNITFTAHWTIKTFEVTFNKNIDAEAAGNVNDWPADTNVTWNTTVNVPDPEPTCDGYRFDGWCTTAECTTKFDFGNTRITEAKTIYAKWVKTFEVKFIAGTGIASIKVGDAGYTSGTVLVKDTNAVVSVTAEVEEGYEPFTAASYTIVCDTNVTLTTTLKTFTVKVPSAEHVTVAVTNGTTEAGTESRDYMFDYGSDVKVVFTAAAGYEFTKNTSTNIVKLVENVEIAAPAVKATEYKITYANVDGVSDDDLNLLPKNFKVEDLVITVRGVSKQGYNFEGWTGGWLEEKKTEFSFNSSEHLGDVTFTANWKIHEYTVTFNKNIAAETAENVNDWPADTNVTWNTTVNTPAKTPTCEGYRFDGWFKNAECTEAFNFTTPIMKPTTIYAKWVKTFEVKFIAGTGIASIKVGDAGYTSGTVLVKDTNAVVSVTAEVEEGYEPFAAASYTIVCDTNVTLTTTLKTYMVTFKSDDADYAVSNNVPHGTEFAKVKPENPTKTGYTFEGWTPEVTEIDGTELTFTAQWTAEDRTVTFYTNSVPFVVRNVKYDQKIGEIPEMPVITGYSGAWRGTAPDAETIVQEDLEYFYDYTAKPFTFTVSGGANATIMVTTNNATAFAYTEPFQIAFDTTWSVEATPNDKFKFNDGAVTSSNGVVNTEAPVTVTLDDAVPAEITINVTWGATIAAVATNGGNVVAGEVKLPADTTEVAFQLTAAEMTIPVFKVAIGDNGAAVVTNKSPVIQVEDGTKITFSAEEAKAEDPTVTEAQKKDAIIDAIDEGASHDAAVEKVNAIVTTEETPAEGKVKASDLAKWITDQKISSTAIAGSDYIVASVKLDVAPITEATAVKVETVEKQTSDLAVTVKIGETDATKEQIQSFVELCDDLGAANDWEKLPESTLKSAVKIEAGKLVITPQAGISKLFLKVVIPADANVN